MSRQKYHPSMATRSTIDLLKRTTDPHHRAILENLRLHALLEVTGNWEQILTPQMTVEHPHYCINDGFKTSIYDGHDEVADFYHGLAESGLGALLGPIDERLMVDDWGVAGHGLWGMQLPGLLAIEQGVDVDDPDAYYYMTGMTSWLWPYDKDARLIGENVIWDSSTFTSWKLDPSEVLTKDEAIAILTPLLDEVLAKRTSA